jgi:hypothetical protein
MTHGHAVLLFVGVVLTLAALMYTSYLAAWEDAENERDMFR